MMGKGYALDVSDELTGDYKYKYKFIYMGIAAGVLFNIKGFQMGVDIVPNIALSGKESATYLGVTGSAKVPDAFWDTHSRFNLDPRITLRYEINAQKALIVPGVFWEMDMLNNAKGTAADANQKTRYMNLMFTLAIAWGF